MVAVVSSGAGLAEYVRHWRNPGSSEVSFYLYFSLCPTMEFNVCWALDIPEGSRRLDSRSLQFQSLSRLMLQGGLKSHGRGSEVDRRL